jgi:DivIVA domain-containing protein
MAAKLNLSPQKIYDKEFHKESIGGYSPEEVDAFLDQVIEDYETYQKALISLKKKADELEKTNGALRAKVIELEGKEKARADSQDPLAYGAENVELLKRISNLENAVFRNGKK